MKTKCIVLDESSESTEKIPIKFKKFLESTSEKFELSYCEPSAYRVIELICRNYGNAEMDLMYAYFSRTNGILYLGHWNNGIV